MIIKPKDATWLRKFQNAFRGIAVGMKGRRTNSFLVHIPMAIAVIAIALFLRVSHLELTVLVMCIGIVLAAELLNSSIEKLARAVAKEQDKNVRDALDIASGAVLVVSLMAVIVGVIVLVSAAIG